MPIPILLGLGVVAGVTGVAKLLVPNKKTTRQRM